MNYISKGLLAFCVMLAVVASVGVFAQVRAASTKETLVAGAGQITLINAVEVRDIKLTSLGMITMTLEDNTKTLRDYDYTVTLYVDGIMVSTSTVSWKGPTGPLPQQRIIPLFIPEGTLNWARITAVVTP